MSIYSANRSGCMSTATIAANESYAFNDCGRIIYESQINDMALFESILACDFKEIQGLNEGTILESEIKALNKESLKALSEKIVIRLKEFWAKIKGVFNSAIQWISNYIAKDSSDFVDIFNSKVGDKIDEWKGSINDVICFDFNNKCFEPFKINETKLKKHAYTDSVEEYISIALSVRADTHDDSVTLSNFTNKMLEKVSYTDTLTSKNIDDYCNRLRNGKAYIDCLNERMREIEKSINEMATKLAKEADNNDATDIIAMAKGMESVQAAIVKANIAAVRNDMKSRRIALQAVMDDILKTDKAVAEAATIDAASDFDDVEPTTALNPETQAQVDELIASADTE